MHTRRTGLHHQRHQKYISCWPCGSKSDQTAMEYRAQTLQEEETALRCDLRFGFSSAAFFYRTSSTVFGNRVNAFAAETAIRPCSTARTNSTRAVVQNLAG